MINKSDLRKQILTERKHLKTKVLSRLICKNILKQKVYKDAKNIFAYYPMSNEVDISELFDDYEKNWFLPRVSGNDLLFCEYSNNDVLKKSEFGVMEPVKKEANSFIPDLIIVPALCVDENNYRLGYGKGFYDRFLCSDLYKSVPTLTPIFSKFIIKELPVNEFDKKISYIVSEL